MKNTVLISLLLILTVLLAACGLDDGGTLAPKAGGVTAPPQTATKPSAGRPSLPPEPQEVTFQAADGQPLTGRYYPAAVDPAPLVVFMHWVGGDQSDWYELAVWLQHRGQANPFPNPGTDPWWDPTWFPHVPESASYGVFIFSFRGCQPAPTGCKDWTPEVWLLDAQAAMLTATTLKGIDPAKVVAIGSSVGADGGADACSWLNQQKPGACQGALSLSPGDYMNIPYPEAVGALGKAQPPAAAWCLADPSEVVFCNRAEEANNPAFRSIEILNGQHGNMLLRPGLDPLPMQLILDFLAHTVG